ncbi:MAG: hypothetical protein J6X53_01975 [Abditibacteriota bacterium]|nr:hypothetical protein [Abditibacteriota bacterium]
MHLCAECPHAPGDITGDDAEPAGWNGDGVPRLSGPGLCVPVNNDDDNGNLSPDTQDSGFEDDDLVRFHPLAGAAECCPCPGHPKCYSGTLRPGGHGRVRLFPSPQKGAEFSGSLAQGSELYAEGLSPSPAPGSELLVWDEFGRGCHGLAQTNAATVFSVRLFPDFDEDGVVDAADVSELPLMARSGWCVMADTGTLHAVQFRCDTLLGGACSLSLTGESGALKLYGSQDRIGGVIAQRGGAAAVVAPQTRTYWLEVGNEGVGYLTATFTGAGDASGYGCSCKLKVSAAGMSLYGINVGDDGQPRFYPDGNAVLGDEIDLDDPRFCCYGAAPNLGNLSFSCVGTNFQGWVTFETGTNSASLFISGEDADSFRHVWFGSATNGVYRYADSNAWFSAGLFPVGYSNAELRVMSGDIPYNATNSVSTNVYLVARDASFTNVWSNAFMSGPREEIGYPPWTTRNGFVVKVTGVPGNAPELGVKVRAGDGDAISLNPENLGGGEYRTECVVPLILAEGTPPAITTDPVKKIARLLIPNGEDSGHIVQIHVAVKFLETPGGREIKANHKQKEVNSSLGMLVSGLITNEKFAGTKRAEEMNKTAVSASSKLSYGVHLSFNPDKDSLLESLKYHDAWIHFGHGGLKEGIMIVKKRSDGRYVQDFLNASDVANLNLHYRLVFMNTCYSSDEVYTYPKTFIGSQVFTFTKVSMPDHAVLDIGDALNADNYVGWSCEVERELSVLVPNEFVKALNTPTNGMHGQTVRDAVSIVQGMHNTFFKDFFGGLLEKLKCVRCDETTFDLDNKP